MVQKQKRRHRVRKKSSLIISKCFIFMERCITCRAIEANTVALLDSLYSKEQAGDRIIYKVIDISKKENEQIADKYEVTWSSLFVNGWKDGKENVNNMTEFSFSNARKSPDKFKEGIKNKVDELLKQL